MPIHSDWKSMCQGLKSTYCAGSSEKKCRPFTDGSSVCLCTKGWNVFFATLNKHGWKEGSPRPKSVSETVMKKAVKETVEDFKEWHEETKRKKRGNVPIKRFEARTHPKPPKGKILKPNPIHIMPKHMQTETVDSYTVAKNTKDGQYYVVNIKKGVATDGPFATEELAKDCIKNLYIPKVKRELGIR